MNNKKTVVLRGGKVFLSVVLLIFVFLSFGCDNSIFNLNKKDVVEDENKPVVTPSAPKLNSFTFDPQINAEIPPELLTNVEIEETRYTFSTQKWIENINKLKAVFQATGTVTVNGVPQESGVTENDFRAPVVYTVTGEDNTETSYTVIFKTPQSTGLPVIKIDTQGGAAITSKTDYTKTNIRLVDAANSANNFANIEYKDEIRGRGNSTWDYPKKPYRIKFNKKTALFGYTAAKSWVLLANYLDPTLIMNTIAFELGNRLGVKYTNHYTHVELFLNGKYEGSYVLTEQVQVGNGRVEVDEDEGFLVEMDTYYDEDPKFRTVKYDLPVMIKSPEDLADQSGYDFVKTAINALTTAVESTAFPNNGYRNLIDMNSFAGFLLVSETVGNIELKHPKSIYMYRDKGSGAKIGMGPLWDFDWAFGNPDQEGKYFQDPQSRVMTQWRTFFKRFYEDPEFKTAYKNLWNDNYSKITGIETFIDEMGTLLAKSQVENAIAINKTTVNYQQQINSMKTWWREHISYLNTEINK